MVRLFCRGPTWTWLFTLTIACVATIAVSGCNFSDFSKTSVASRTPTPACAASSALSADAGAPEGIAEWTFDDEPTPSRTWHDSQEQRLLTLQPTTSQPIEAVTRLNGRGHALYLDGQSYAVNENADGALSPEQGGFTVSAWISIRLEDFNAGNAGGERIWPIVSTIGSAGHCGGYQLDLRSAPGADGPVLAFSYQTTSANDAGDCTNVLAIPLNRPSWAWGNGRWHHIAATYDDLGKSQVSLALYIDGELLQKNTPESSIYDGAIAYADHAFYVGTNGTVSAVNNSNFKGHIDDVALFGLSLSASEVSTLNLAKSTDPGPSNCRWNALEQWDFDAGSSATWSPNSTESSAKLRVNDLDWGAGFLSARLLPDLELSLFDTAYLTADVPPGSGASPLMFEFSLSSDDDSCSWMLAANGPDRYVIDLRRPSFCVSTSCSFKTNHVQWARVSSEWASIEHTFDISVTRLEFDTIRDPTVETLPLGGAIGPEGWCWRPQAYNINALAFWAGTSAPSPDSLSASFAGQSNSTVRIAADFGDRSLDLRNCRTAVIDADIPDLGSNTLFNFALLDANGAEQNWNFVSGSGPIKIDMSEKPSYDSKTQDPVVFANVPAFDVSHVRLVGIDKPYQYATSAPLQITIRDVRFYALDGSRGCEVPSKR